MDKTEQDPGTEGAENGTVKNDEILVKEQSRISEEITDSGLITGQEETESETKKSRVEISCNGVNEKETVVNGDHEKTNVDSSITENDMHVPGIESNNSEIFFLENGGTNLNLPENSDVHVNTRVEKDVTLNGISEKDCSDSSVLESAIKEPDKNEIKEAHEDTCIDQNFQELGDKGEIHVSQVASEVEKHNEISCVNLETEEKSDAVADSTEIEEEENKELENEKTSDEVSDLKEKQPEELQKISSEVVEFSNSSGPPSLVKEVISDDNSIVSDQIDHEESMEIDEKPVIAESEKTVIAESEKPVIAESEKPAIAEIEKPAIAECEKPVIAESEKPVITESEKPAIAESEKPAIAEYEKPVIAENEKPVIAENVKAVIVENQSDIKSSDTSQEVMMSAGKKEQQVVDSQKCPEEKSEECKAETEAKSDLNAVLQSKTLSKGQKLDQLLSKITTKAETDSQKVNPPSQKPAKARKSCVSSMSSSISKPSISPSITSLTFNVKELEKKGVLDMPKPKPSKRKAFEPIKIPSPDKDSSLSSKKNSPIRSPVKSPLRSPSKTENPFFKKQKLIRKKKKRFKNTYKLPGEKVWKKTKSKKSEERQLQSEKDGEKNIYLENQKEHSDLTVSEKQTSQVQSGVPVTCTPDKMVGMASNNRTAESSPGQKSALDMLTMNSKKSFNSAVSGSSMKKARKTVRQAIEPATHRTLDSFLKFGSHPRKMQETVTENRGMIERSSETPNGEQRKRKVMDPVRAELSTSPNYVIDNSISSPEEKKRKMDMSQSPQQQQMITLLPTGSPPMSIPAAGHPIMPAAGNPIIPPTGTGSQILLSPCTSSGSQTIIQNGTLNGLPVFQIFSNQSIASSQTAQFVAIAQSQGRPILTNSSPSRTTNLMPQKGVPVLFTPVPLTNVVTASIGSQTQVIASKPGVINSVTSSVLGNQTITIPSMVQSTVQQQHSVLKNTLTQPRMQLPNGTYIDLKLLPKDVPNGMYPVTPPKTPEEQRSETGSQDMGEEMEAVLGSVTPDKDVIPLCTCKISGASFQKMTTIVTFCQALDSVDGKVLGCCNKVTNPQLVRPAVKIPFLALCDSHRKRLRLHQCCPGCGHFCTQGKFLQCKKEGSSFVHNFHEQCQVTKDGKNFCPHCGETSSQYEVHLSMLETKQSMAKDIKPSQRTQVKARIGLVEKKASGGDEEPSEEPVVTHILEKSKKVLSTADIPTGPDRYSLERVLSSLTLERPKKYRHLPKCLYTPAYDNDLERVVYMLEDGHDPNELYEDLEGQSALHAAAAVGSLSIVHVLIQAGASPHHQDKSLKTPLMFAAENNHLDVVKYLIRANATIDAKADDGMSALHLAAKAGHVNIINILLDTERINIDITDDGGWTPLIWAAEHMEVEAVKLLLKRKADPNLRDSEENTTMHWAAFSGSVAIAELLLAAGCDLDSLNMHGDRPLHIAARQDHYECVVLFLARGADVEAKNNKGESPLECCIEQNTAVYLALKVNKQLKSFGAKHMGKPEKLIHRDLSKGRENIPIPCVNGVDDEGEPKDYLYVVDNIETTCLNINRVIGSLQSCQCKDDCSSIYCACGKNSVRCWYDKYNRLIPEFNMTEPPLIFECNRACECWTTCNNRVVQNGVMSRLQVFKTVGRGWGCKTLVDIPRGTFICEYIGEHISDSEADRREDDSYLFDLDNKDGETYCIDARRYGNVARFINHLCEPNLTPVKVFVDTQDLRFPRICLFANRDIKAQEELGFDYGEKFWIIKWKQFTCTCGSLKCRYSSDTIQKTLEEYRQRHEIDGEEMQE